MVNGVVCKGSHVFSIALEKRVVELSHHALKGISLVIKRFLRTFCWFPEMGRAVKNQVRGSLPCKGLQLANNDQPVKPSELIICQ